MQTVSRKQHDLLCTAKALARRLSVDKTATEYSIHPGAVAHHRRRLRHLRVTADDVNAIIGATGEHADEYLLALFAARRREQKQRSKAAKQTANLQFARKAKGGVAL